MVSVSDSWPGGCELDPRLRRLFFPAYFRLSPLQKHVRKVVGGFGKKSCVSTGVRKARKHICVTDRHDMTLAVKVALNPNTTNQFIQRTVSLMVILFSTKCFLFVYMYIDLLKLKANKLFENSDADLPWLLYKKEANLYRILLSFYGRWEETLRSLGHGKRRVTSLTPSKSYQVNACQIKAPKINSYYFLNPSFYFTIFCLASIWQEDSIKFWQELTSIYYGSLVQRPESLSLAQSLSSVCFKSLYCAKILRFCPIQIQHPN